MADALASGASVRKDVGVQVPPRALSVREVVRTTNARSTGGIVHTLTVEVLPVTLRLIAARRFAQQGETDVTKSSTRGKRIVLIGIAAALVYGVAAPADAVPPPLPPGTVVTCTQISGRIVLRPGIGATGTSSGVKWRLKAVANNCTVPPNSAGVVPVNVVAAIITGTGYFVGGNTCAAAAVASNYGAQSLAVQWISTPTVATTVFSPVATGAFNLGTALDSIGITQDRNHVPLAPPTNLIFGGDWTAASAAQYATDCSGAAPIVSTYFFQTPAGLSPHNPAFVLTN